MNARKKNQSTPILIEIGFYFVILFALLISLPIYAKEVSVRNHMKQHIDKSPLFVDPPFIVTGHDITSNIGLIVSSTDAGTSWNVRSFSNNPLNGYVMATTCMNQSNPSTCFAVGTVATENASPILVNSTDGGATWSLHTITGLNTGAFAAIYCTDTTCVAVGRNFDSQGPLIYVSSDNGKTWNVKTITNGPTFGVLYGINCTGTGSSAICVAVGRTGDYKPLVVSSIDGGNSWSVQRGANQNLEFLSQANCKNSSGSVSCFIVGGNQVATNPPEITFSSDGINWSSKTVNNMPTAGYLYNVNCSGNTSSDMCIAVGEDTTTSKPLLAASTNGGSSWQVQSITGGPTSGALYGATCLPGTPPICFASGDGDGAPLIVGSTDNGVTWKVQTINSSPRVGSLYDIDCRISGSNKVCTAGGGEHNGTQSPLLVASLNGGTTWNVQSITGNPTFGCFYAVNTNRFKQDKRKHFDMLYMKGDRKNK